MKSQRQRGWDVHRQLNHPVDLEMLELPRLRRKTKSLKKCLRTLWMIYLWVQMSKTVWTFFPMVITKRKRKRRRTRKKKIRRRNQRTWKTPGEEKKDLVIKDDNGKHQEKKKRPSHQRWQSLARFGEKNSKGKADPVILQAAWWCLV